MSSKRKSRGSDAALETPDSKRHKAVEAETAERTSAEGIALLKHLKVARDKRNHAISTEFETLPDKDETPDYYDVVKLPIALDTIEGKLERQEYPTLTTLESDFKRMVANAKAYNDKASDIVGDAEKIRKLVSNFMVKKNPAYRDPEYSAFATPIPGDEKDPGPTPGRKRTKVQGQEDTPEKGAAPTPDPPKENRRVLKIRGPKETEAGKASPAAEPATEDDAEDDDDDEGGAEDAGESFEGNTFQQAQQKIVTELMDFSNDEGLEISGPFLNLPPRTLKDYYQAIKYPVSLKAVQKRVRGIRGRDVPTGVSHFKSWQAFADELSFVWNNARTYNEDGSEIFEAANELEAYFKKRLEEAKAAVPEPTQPKVTLRVPAKDPDPTTKLKLHLSSKPPGPESDGVMVDHDALKRQQDLVAAGAAAQARPSTSSSGVRASAEAQPTANGLVNGVKAEATASQSPAIAAQASPGSEAAPMQNGSMPPPSTAPNADGSPMPSGPRPTPPAPRDPYEQRTRTDGKGIADALFESLTLATHPSLRATHNRRYEFFPSAKLTQQNACIHLEPTHTLFQVAVLLPATLSQRSHKHLLKLNKQILHPVGPGSHMEGVDPRAIVYEVNLIPGLVNAVELEVLLCLSARGNPKHGPAAEYEYERFSVFANVYAA